MLVVLVIFFVTYQMLALIRRVGRLYRLLPVRVVAIAVLALSLVPGVQAWLVYQDLRGQLVTPEVLVATQPTASLGGLPVDVATPVEPDARLRQFIWLLLGATALAAGSVALFLRPLAVRRGEAQIRRVVAKHLERHTEHLAGANFDLGTQLILLRQTESSLRLYRKVFECAAEAIVITELDGTIIDVNAAFEATTGYSRQEAIGSNPRISQSGKHDRAFYEAMWEEIRESGGWSGEIWDRRKNGELYPKLLSIRTVFNDRSEPVSYVGVFTDISRLKHTERELEQLAFYDRLTGLPNRRLLLDRMEHALALAKRNSICGALFFLDLDHFKKINDTKGHQVGDLLLIEVARRLRESVRGSDTVGRLAGDEFLVLAEDLSENRALAAVQARAIGEKIVTALAEAYRIEDFDFHCSTSLGIAVFGPETPDMEGLLVRADTAMYEAKKCGRNTLRFFDPAMQDALQQRVDLENRMRNGLRHGQFYVVFQPQHDERGHVAGFEALARWDDPVRGEIPPTEFIPVAEESSFIRDIDRWVLETVCATLVGWDAIPVLRDLPVSINASAASFNHPEFVDDVLATLSGHRLSARRLKIELTESVVMGNFEASVARMRQLQAAGIRLAMDDFGTGYSSLAYLRRLPFDQIKIDKSFVARMLEDSNDAFIVHSILSMGLMLEVEIMAEGVELQAHHEALTAMGCRLFQGYLIGRPLRTDECPAWAQAWGATAV